MARGREIVWEMADLLCQVRNVQRERIVGADFGSAANSGRWHCDGEGDGARAEEEEELNKASV